MFLDYVNEKNWLQARTQWVGASEAAAAIGLSPFSSNIDLWEIKTGLKKAPDLRMNERVQKGHLAEEHIRALFMVDNGDKYSLIYHPFGVYWKEETPFLRSTLDGLLIEKETGKRIILEIKNCKPNSAAGWDNWKDGFVPQYYMVQMMCQMWCADADGAIMKARLQKNNGDIIAKHVFFDRASHEDDIRFVVNGVSDFWKHVERKTRPAAILPFL